MRQAAWIVGLMAVGIAGFVAGQWWQQPAEAPYAPDDWLARVGDEYITREEFVAEMERRGGLRPGQYQSVDQRRSLLNEMIIRTALVDAARRDGFDERPEVARAMDAILVSRYQQSRLEPLRDSVEVSPSEVRAYYEGRADDYSVPARKRIAMIHVVVPENAADEARDRARERAEDALKAIGDLETGVPHFGDVARRFSDDQASRYRGGVIGWISEEPVRPRFDTAVAEAAADLEAPGETTGIVEGKDGFYIVRLVQRESRQERSLEQLAPGIRQHIRREKLRAVERRFLDEQLARANPEIDEAALAEIQPLTDEEARPPTPPAGPTNEEDET